MPHQQYKDQESRIEAVLDQLLDAASDDREKILEDLAHTDETLAGRARALLNCALDETLGNPSVQSIAPDILHGLANSEEGIRIGERVGPYELTRFIRRGGMGVVYCAQRADGAFEQTVAVKFLPSFLASASRKKLFERERAYLARLEHPNIARIIDAGIAEDQTPYFVMEFIDGEPISQYADKLGLRSTLELFLQLCDAVAYCHRSFIVHGDLKPQNVLVADDRVRLLDFGVGRLITEDDGDDQKDADLVNGFSRRYAAPEQLHGAAPTIQSDVYSLGIMLHQFISRQSTSPEKLDKPSTPNAQAQDANLPKDLVAIIRRAMAESPADRYESVDALRRDILAWLHDYPVEARDGALAYRGLKFIARNRILIGAMTTVVAALSIGLAAAVWQYRLARIEAARAREVTVFVTSLFDRAHPDIAGEEDVTLRQIMDEAAARLSTDLENTPTVRNEIKQLIAVGYSGIGEYDKSLKMHEEVLAYWRNALKAPDVTLVKALNNLGTDYYHNGRRTEAIELHQEALAQLKAMDMSETELAANSWTRLGDDLMRVDQPAAVTAMTNAYEIYRQIKPENDQAVAYALANLAAAKRLEGNAKEALQLSERALEIAGDLNLYQTPSLIATRCNMGLDYGALGQHAKARAAHALCLEQKIDRLGPDHPDLVSAYNNLASVDMALGRLGAAEGEFGRGLEMAENKLPPAALSRLVIETNYSLMLWRTGRAELALDRLESIQTRMEESFGAEHPAANRTRSILGRIILELGDPDRAEALIQRSFEGLRPVWRSDALLWLAETKLAKGNEEIEAARLASESLALRQSLPEFTDWDIAEAEYILAKASNDAALMAKATDTLRTLPGADIRKRAIGDAFR